MRPASLSSTRSPSADSLMPIRYSSRKLESIGWARLNNAIVAQLAVNSRHWSQSGAITFDALRPLVGRFEEEAAARTSALVEGDPETLRATAGGEASVARILKRRAPLGNRGFAVGASSSSTAAPVPVASSESSDDFGVDATEPLFGVLDGATGVAHLEKCVGRRLRAVECGAVVDRPRRFTTVGEMKAFGVTMDSLCPSCMDVADEETKSTLICAFS